MWWLIASPEEELGDKSKRNGASAMGKDICYMLCVLHGALSFVCGKYFAGGKDRRTAEAVHLEARTWRNKDGATINYS